MSELFEHIGEGQFASSHEYNRLLDAVAGLLKATGVQYFEDSRGMHARRMPVAAIPFLQIFQITAVGTWGRYTCKKYRIDSSDWTSGSGVSKLIKVNDDEYDVFNVAENATTVSNALDIDDVLLASEDKDNAGNLRWVGFTPKFAWWDT